MASATGGAGTATTGPGAETAEGFTTTGSEGGMDATAGASGAGTALADGRATTAPTTGRLAIAGTVYVGAGGRGIGTTRRGAGVEGAGTTVVGAGTRGAAVATVGLATTGGRWAGGATVTAGRGGGAALAALSACFRSRIALRASPGLDTCERSNFGLVSTGATRGATLRAPRLKYPRTFSASSSSMELECVFFSVTPTAVRASRMDRLLTSNSRARSLMRTLLIRPFSVPLRT